MHLSEPISVLDVIELRDGRYGTVLEIYDAGSAFIVEITDTQGRTQELPIVHLPDIVRVIWKSNKAKK